MLEEMTSPSGADPRARRSSLECPGAGSAGGNDFSVRDRSSGQAVFRRVFWSRQCWRRYPLVIGEVWLGHISDCSLFILFNRRTFRLLVVNPIDSTSVILFVDRFPQTEKKKHDYISAVEIT